MKVCTLCATVVAQHHTCCGRCGGSLMMDIFASRSDHRVRTTEGGDGKQVMTDFAVLLGIVALVVIAFIVWLAQVGVSRSFG